jgi:hypothetical protein
VAVGRPDIVRKALVSLPGFDGQLERMPGSVDRRRIVVARRHCGMLQKRSTSIAISGSSEFWS